MLDGFIANLVRFDALWDSSKCNESSNQCLSVYQGQFTGKPLSHLDKLAIRLGWFKFCFSDSDSQSCCVPGAEGSSQATAGQTYRSLD